MELILINIGISKNFIQVMTEYFISGNSSILIELKIALVDI